MGGDPPRRVSIVRITLAVLLVLAGAWAWLEFAGQPPLTSAGARVANSVTWTGYRGFRVERGLHPVASLEVEALALVVPALAQRGLSERGSGPAQAADEFAVRIVESADDAAGVRTTVAPAADAGAPGASAPAVGRLTWASDGPTVTVEFRGSTGALWTGVFPAEAAALRQALRLALEPMRFQP